MLRVAVLIPALDEEAGLAQVLRELPRSGRVAAARETPFEVCEIVVVDNGSRDRTPDVARAGGATVVVEPRRGYGAACLAGLAWLRRDPPDVVVFLDADASDDPREIDGLLAPIVGGADLVVGCARPRASRARRADPCPGVRQPARDAASSVELRRPIHRSRSVPRHSLAGARIARHARPRLRLDGRDAGAGGARPTRLHRGAGALPQAGAPGGRRCRGRCAACGARERRSCSRSCA